METSAKTPKSPLFEERKSKFLSFMDQNILADSSLQSKFVQTNGNLLMPVTKEVQIGKDLFFWKFNKSNNILRLIGNNYTIIKSYKGRVEFFPQNLSLMLKKVQRRDSGTYTAMMSGDKDEILATYDVTVQDPVSAVLLRVDSVSNSSESCNFTVSCTTESSSISRSFTCDRLKCGKAHPSHSTPSLHLYQSDKSIICNHSNHVSWRNDTKDIQVCPLFGTKEPVGNTAVIVGVIGGLLFIGLCILVAVVLCKKKQSQRENPGDEIRQASSSGSGYARAPGEDIELKNQAPDPSLSAT